MARNSPITMTFPPFAGVTRKLILANVAVFFGLLLLHWVSPGVAEFLLGHLLLEPLALLRGELWQPVTYSFLTTGILDILFGMLTLWFCGSLLEGVYGAQWLAELYFTSAIGGALLASAISFTHIFGLTPLAAATGAWAGIFGLLIAIAMRFGEQEFLLWFVLRIKAKYMVAIYILIAIAILLKGGNAFTALLQLAGALCGFLYVHFAPRRGLAFGFSERYFGLRNGYYRWKRRRAARKFEVYMGKQGRKVHFDKDGRYIDPDTIKKNPNDRSWMN
ncbi:rhomboid family intramembrane serine protease [Granulicella arctica]|uniref:Membrane associated rhomboid family serine protease n=1 Tax=Granulicella arctica TaxID=940613 RepID=A0A7Y9TF97_9BACT|nr:rhomboid family intramembrane serine protease [Granulicella arctica]NYF78491.1 membrane associated rhomboid family serine protease [Granulicella arctica]